MRGEEELADLRELLDADCLGGVERELRQGVREHREHGERDERQATRLLARAGGEWTAHPRDQCQDQWKAEPDQVPQEESARATTRVSELVAQREDVAAGAVLPP